MRKFIALAVVTVLLLLAANPVLAAPPKDSYKPLKASDVEIVKKVTLNGPAARGGKTSPFVATGVLGDPCTGKRYAILIGIKDYPGSGSDLQFTVADADLMSDVLANTYGFSPRNIYELTDAAATKTAIFDTVNEVKARAGAGDEVVFFFSGHGAKGKVADGDNNMDQAIVVQEDGKFAFIWDGELKDWFSGLTASRIVFVFDSCLSGGMSVLNKTGRVVCMGSTINSMSLEGTQWGGGHGQFTYFFAEEGMEYGRADVRPDDSLVTVEEAFDYAGANCKSQIPTIADGFTDDLLP